MKHANLAAGRWFELSLKEQLGNVGSEVNRALRFKDKDMTAFDNAVERALELLDLTISDVRWRGRLKELLRAREMFCAALYPDNDFNSTLEDIDKYFFQFALAARLSR